MNTFDAKIDMKKAHLVMEDVCGNSSDAYKWFTLSILFHVFARYTDYQGCLKSNSQIKYKAKKTRKHTKPPAKSKKIRIHKFSKCAFHCLLQACMLGLAIPRLNSVSYVKFIIGFCSRDNWRKKNVGLFKCCLCVDFLRVDSWNKCLFDWPYP